MQQHAQPTAATSDGVTTAQVWRALEKASFLVLAYITPAGEPRSSGVVYAAVDRRLAFVVAADSWKGRHIRDGDTVAVTVPIRRGGLLSLVAPIPPATVTLRTRARVRPPASLERDALAPKLARLLPADLRNAILIELEPFGHFLTYGVGVSLREMIKPELARGRVPVS